jgi:ethanolamine permease
MVGFGEREVEMSEPRGSEPEGRRERPGGVEYERVGREYLEQRQLQKGVAGWVLLAGLGVAYVISGEFGGWQFGLAEGGWGGLLIATILTATMYTTMVFALAELSAAIPVAGAGYGFARRAMGVWGGFLTGTAIVIEYAIAPAAIATFIGAYVESLIGFGGPLVYLIFYAAFIGMYLYGTGEALRIMFVITAVAVVGIVVFVVGMIPHLDSANMFNIAPTDAAGASSFLPFGYLGIWAAFPFAIWFFLGIEGLPLAAEETRDPATDMPKGMIAGMLALLLFAALILIFAPGGGGSAEIQNSGAPLTDALASPNAYGGKNTLFTFVNVVGIAGLVASFYSLIYAYSRQIFALSRAGYLPRWLSLTSRRHVPWVALVVPGVIGFLLALTGQGDLLVLISVFGATVSYVLMMLAHIILRYREPDLERPYKTPGGVFTSGTALVLGVASVIAGFLVDPRVLIGAAIVYGIMIAYFAIHSRHHLVAQAPEEEFEAIERAEAELEE